MGKNGEPKSLDVEGIISASNAIAAAAKPKEILADPVHQNGVFKQEEPELVDIKALIAKQEAERVARVDERLATVRASAKKNSSIPGLVDVA